MEIAVAVSQRRSLDQLEDQSAFCEFSLRAAGVLTIAPRFYNRTVILQSDVEGEAFTFA
jgi:hypothetical protein